MLKHSHIYFYIVLICKLVFCIKASHDLHNNTIQVKEYKLSNINDIKYEFVPDISINNNFKKNHSKFKQNNYKQGYSINKRIESHNSKNSTNIQQRQNLYSKKRDIKLAVDYNKIKFSKKAVQAPATKKSLLEQSLKNDIKEIICETNKLRKGKGLSELKVYDTISQEAQFHAEYMSKNDLTTHINPAGSIGSRLSKKKVGWIYVSENVAGGFTIGKSVVSAWNKSPDHSLNMFNSKITHIGIGRSGKFWVQNFVQMIPSFKNDSYFIKC
ncbi:hypothetical protein BB561_002725 [Smittium simulii]|uniref:SCP domain-containing protein n=1 Tax=Smittium simulii TaxID=133385 RepID=A0A2T9YPH1_9FUNG|nr:hypothetical protein BB561_002725 [Smittium simulii]